MPSTPESSEDHYYKALDLLEQNAPQEACLQFRRCLELNPKMDGAWHGLIRALREMGKFDEAIAAAETLIALDPEEPLAHTGLSILYQHKGMIPEAEAESLKAKVLGWKKQLREERP
jgi:tetratricopeptide (TPR) repeat protein